MLPRCPLLYSVVLCCAVLLVAAVCCCLLLVAAGCCCLLLVAAVCCCLLLLAMNAMNRGNFDAKFTSSCCCLPAFAYISLCNGLSPKSTADGPKIDHLGTLKPFQNHQKSMKIRSGSFLGPIWNHFGADAGTILGSFFDSSGADFQANAGQMLGTF